MSAHACQTFINYHVVFWLSFEVSPITGSKQPDGQFLLQHEVELQRHFQHVMVQEAPQVNQTDGQSLVHHEVELQAQQVNQSAHPSFIVLLTTYNEPSRSQMYEKRLEWWLSQTTLPIYVVDSYNAPLAGNLTSFRKFREHHFDQTLVLGTPPAGGSTPAEILSMKNAFEAFKDDWAHVDYVVKITGKYVLPTLTSALATVSKGSDFIVEFSNYNMQSPWVGTECLGFNAKRMGKLLAEIEVQDPLPVESKVATLLRNQARYSHQRLPLMKIPEGYQIKRGAGDTLGYL